MTLEPPPAPSLRATLGSLLRLRRHQAGLTIEQLSERSWVSVRAISNMERGESLGPQRKTMEALADALALEGVDREQFLVAARRGRHRTLDPAPSALALPRDVGDFTGRSAETARLEELAVGLDGSRAAVCVISGVPGAGKTSLAIHAADALRDCFPVGQYFVDLRGLEHDPVEPQAVLAKLLRALDPTLPHLPVAMDDRSALLRDLTTRRRILVILDNAANEAQLRPLLPSRGASLFVITSRRLLSGLEGVHRIRLGALTGSEATQLLGDLRGGPPDTDPRSLEQLATISGNLPLALRIVGNRLSARPDWNPERLAAQLQDEQRRLHTLVAGDLAVSTAFGLSYQLLSPAAATLFRRCALIPSGETNLQLAAVLSELSTPDTADILYELVEAGLVETGYSGRYHLHDLLRLYAHQRFTDEEDQATREAATKRVTGWLLATATAAARRFDPEHLADAQTAQTGVDLRTPEAAMRWLTDDLDNWMPAVRAATGEAGDQQVLELAEAIHWFSDRVRHWETWVEFFELASKAAERQGDLRALAGRLNDLAWAYVESAGDPDRALAAARRAHAIASDSADLVQQGWAKTFECKAHIAAARYELALAPARQAYECFVSVGDELSTVQALAWVGRCLEELGRDEEAIEWHERRLQLALRSVTSSPSMDASAVSARTSISRLHGRQGRWPEAVEDLRTVDVVTEPTGFPFVDAKALHAQGHALCSSGQTESGIKALRHAKNIYRSTDHQSLVDQIDALIDKFAQS